MGLADDSRKPLRFFGEVSAAVSHDIKNVFAIINEDAGLMGDLALMAEKGMPLDPQKLSTVAAKIQKQIKRGDLIVKNMNSFAHSIDDPVKEIDICATVKLVCELLKRRLDAKNVEIIFNFSKAVIIRTDPFMFEMAVSNVLFLLMNCPLKEEGIRVTSDYQDDGASLIFSGIAADSDCYDEEGLKNVMEDLNGRLQFDKTSGVLKISLPAALSV